MLELKNVCIDLSQNGRPLVENLSFTLGAGDKAVIIGEEGNGKSTLLKYIFDARLISGYCDCGGEVIKKGICAYLPQMLDPSLEKVSLCDYFSGTAPYAYFSMLRSMGLAPELLDSGQLIGTLSGGEKVKIQLAKLLMAGPDILLLDEPTNDLDIETLEWFGGFIKNQRLPVLFISHDETLIENTANMIIHMEQLRRKTRARVTVTRSGYRDYVSSRQDSFEKQAQIAGKQREEYGKKMERWQQIHDRVEHEQRSLTRQDPHSGRLLKKKMKSVQAQARRFERETEDFLDFPEAEDAIITRFSPEISTPCGKTVLDISLPSLEAGERTLAKNIRLFVSGGERIGITGRNGAGKSTLLEAIWAILRERRYITAGFMPQDYSQVLDYGISPIEFLTGRYSKDEVTRARTFMGSMRFTHEEMTGKISRLSGGQRAKLLFLDMVLKNADTLVLDEPTRNFSPLSGPVVRDALRSFGGTIISVSHDRKYLEEVCTRVLLLTQDGLEPVK